jgi:hypothetical protein
MDQCTEAAAQLGGGWRVARKLAGGLNQGAYLVRGPGGDTAVLKSYPGDADRIAAAALVVRAAREHGWPTPAWLAAGTTRAGGAWVLQEFAGGRRPALLDERVAALMVGVLEVQAGSGRWPARGGASRRWAGIPSRHTAPPEGARCRAQGHLWMEDGPEPIYRRALLEAGLA